MIYWMKKYSSVFVGIFVLLWQPMQAADNEVDNVFEYRVSSELVFKFDPIKRFTFTSSPELRYDASNTLTKGLVQMGASYKVVSFMSLNAAYRFSYYWGDVKQHSYDKYLLDVSIKEHLDRFGLGFRVRYTNDADDWSGGTDDQYVRFKASTDYDIKGFKIKPKLGLEVFQEIGQTEVYKYRSSFGLSRKLLKGQYLELAYKLDFFMLKYKNKYIFSLNYKFKL